MAKEKRSYSSSFESQSIYSDSKFACERVKSPGYHYNPVSKDTYGVTPRKINARDFTVSIGSRGGLLGQLVIILGVTFISATANSCGKVSITQK